LPLPPESIHGRSRFQVSPLAPRPGPKPWRFAAWRIWNLRSASRLRGSGKPKPSVPQPAGSSAEASVPPGSPWTEILGLPFAVPGPKPGPARQIGAEARFRRWRRADRNPAFRRAGPEPEGPVSCLPVPRARRLSVPMGASRSLPLSHPLKGKPAIVRLAAASSAALPFASSRPAARRRPAGHPLRLWLGRLSFVSERSSRPHPEAVMKKPGGQAESACG
jgi:hypothetical protein